MEYNICNACVVILRRSSYLDYVAFVIGLLMNDALKNLEGNGSGLIEVLSQHFFGDNEETHSRSPN
jgi:hypothetical protein